MNGGEIIRRKMETSVKPIPLLMTATVNPNGMQGAAFSVEERAAQYREAVAFYLRVLPEDTEIVFAENSASVGLISKHFEGEKRVEWLDVSQLSSPYIYDQSRGKGYNEWLLMREAVVRSKKIAQADCFFKVTGRLRVMNICSLLNEVRKRGISEFLADCKDHGLYEFLRMPINGHAGECRYFFACRSFYLQQIFPGFDRMNDYSQPPYLAEDQMLLVCRRSRTMQGTSDRFRTQVRISGKGAHALGKGAAFFYSTDNDSFALRFKCALRQLLRWFFPWWRC